MIKYMAIGLVLLLGLGGCMGNNEDVVIDVGVTTEPNAMRPLNPPFSGVWPAKINIGGIHPDATVDEYIDGSPLAICVYNANDYDSVFSIYHFIPSINQVCDGYSPAPFSVANWLTYDVTVSIPAHTWLDVPFVIKIPANVVFLPISWEFWMVAMDTTQGGMVQAANAIIILVDSEK